LNWIKVKLIIITIISLNDLAFTLIQYNDGYFIESNPIAQWLYEISPYALVVFKLLSLIVAIWILWRYHARLFTKVVVWSMFFVYLFLVCWWISYFSIIAS